MSQSKKGTYKKIKTTTKTYLKKKKLKRWRKNYFKIRAYKKVDGSKYYGKYSSIKGVKTK